MRAGHGLERLEIGVEGLGHLRRLDGEQDVPDAGADGGFGALAHADAHGRRRLEGQQQALGVLGIADAVVEQVPVQTVHPRLAGMAAGAALPALEADARVVEVKLALPRARSSAASGPSGMDSAFGYGPSSSNALSVSEK